MGNSKSKSEPPPPPPEPWRIVQDLAWTNEFKDEFYETVYETDEAAKKQGAASPTGILVIGPSHHGKSSFINSLATVSKKVKCGIANSGSENTQVTTLYRRLKCPGKLGKIFWLGDIKGLTKCSEEDGLVTDIKTLLAGHMKPGYKFMPQQPLKKTSKYYIQKPEPSDKIHGVIIVYSSTHTDDIQQEYTAGLRRISKLMHEKNIPRCVVLTKCDILCNETARDTSKIFHSKKVQTAVKQAVSAFGVPEGDVHPVVNYEKDIKEDPLKSIPLLLCLNAVLNRAQDHSFQEEVQADTDDNEDESEHET